MKPILARIVTYIFVGILIVIMIVGFVLLSYLLIAGAMVGLILFIAGLIKEKFFPSKNIVRQNPPRQGRTIDHEK